MHTACIGEEILDPLAAWHKIAAGRTPGSSFKYVYKDTQFKLSAWHLVSFHCFWVGTSGGFLGLLWRSTRGVEDGEEGGGLKQQVAYHVSLHGPEARSVKSQSLQGRRASAPYQEVFSGLLGTFDELLAAFGSPWSWGCWGQGSKLH